MTRRITLIFDNEDDFADVLVAIRGAHGSSTKDSAERGAAIAAICRSLAPRPLASNGPLPGQATLPIFLDVKGA